MGPNGKGRRGPDPGSLRPHARPDGPPGPEEPSSPTAVTVRTGTAQDAGVAATLHANQIAEGFLSFLGSRFLARLYRRVTLTTDSFLIVADCGGRPCGFIAGSTDVPGLYRSFLWHDGIRAGAAAAGRLAVGWRRVLETLRHGSSDGAGVGRGAELLAVAVDPGRQGRGVGGRLVAGFLDEVTARGLGEAHVVVGADNAGAVALYERAGFVPVDRFELHPGTESLLMQWDRPSSQAGPD